MEEKITYFEEPGKINTEKTLRLAKERASSRGIKKVVLATTRGFTPTKALEIFKDTNITLTIVAASKSIPQHLVDKLEKEGHNWVFCDDLDYNYPKLAKNTLRRLSEGMKVCVEVAMIAADASLIMKGEEIVAVAGTGYIGFEERGGGADTAIVLEALDSKSFFDIRSKKEERRKIKEIICKPH